MSNEYPGAPIVRLLKMMPASASMHLLLRLKKAVLFQPLHQKENLPAFGPGVAGGSRKMQSSSPAAALRSLHVQGREAHGSDDCVEPFQPAAALLLPAR